MRTADALRAAAKRIDRLDAEVLLAYVLGSARLDMLMNPDRIIDAAAFEALVARRATGEPVAYITGSREFWSLDLRVTPDVLIPRPDSETLIEVAVRHFGSHAPATVLDLGTGSGALLLAALSQWPGAHGVGIDESAAALAVAQGNAHSLGMAARASFASGDWAGTGAMFDLILCNPPYIECAATLPADVVDWEPHGALFAGDDGRDDYRLLAPLLAPQLAPGGLAALEIGHGQAESVTALFVAQGLHVVLHRDLAGLPRCLAITK